MFCTTCGNQIAPGSAFCTGCGAPAPEAPVQASPIPEVPVQEAPVQNVVYTEPAFQAAPGQEFAPTVDQGMNFDFSSDSAQAVSGKRYEYKVLSQKDKWFSGKFDPQLLEQALNAYAQQGWKVIDCATADITGFGTTRQEFITVMEREL